MCVLTRFISKVSLSLLPGRRENAVKESFSMYILLTNEEGRIEEGVILAVSRSVMRIAVRGQSDTAEILLCNGVWMSDCNHRFEIEAVTAGTESEMAYFGDVFKAQVLTAGMRISSF